MFQLKAVRETDERRIAVCPNLQEAADVVTMLEEAELWPEGYDAVCTAFGGMQWMLVSDEQWERVDELFRHAR